jgi:hypothetical protein
VAVLVGQPVDLLDEVDRVVEQLAGLRIGQLARSDTARELTGDVSRQRVVATHAGPADW